MFSVLLNKRRLANHKTWQPSAARVVLISYYMLIGLVVGTTGVLWEALRQGLKLSDGLFGTTVLLTPLAGLVVMVCVGRLTAWAGKRSLAITSALFIAISEIAMALVAEVWVFVVVRVLVGIGYGLLEASINSAALDWERATGRDLMNPLHGAFSAAAVLGSLLAGALLAASWSYQAILLGLGALALLLCVATLLVQFPPATAGPVGAPATPASLRLLRSHPKVVALAAICLLGATAEGVAGFWSVIHLRNLGAGLLLSGAALALFNGTMFFGRILNTMIVARWGTAVSFGLSAGGTLLAATLLALPSTAAAVSAFMLLGLAISGVIPTALSAASRRLPADTTTIATLMMAAAFVGFVLAPFAVGWAAEPLGLRGALITTLGSAALMMFWLNRMIARQNEP